MGPSKIVRAAKTLKHSFSIVSTAFFYVRTTLLEWFVLAFATVLAFVPVLGTELAAVALFAAVYFLHGKRASAITREAPASAPL